MHKYICKIFLPILFIVFLSEKSYSMILEIKSPGLFKEDSSIYIFSCNGVKNLDCNDIEYVFVGLLGDSIFLEPGNYEVGIYAEPENPEKIILYGFDLQVSDKIAVPKFEYRSLCSAKGHDGPINFDGSPTLEIIKEKVELTLPQPNLEFEPDGCPDAATGVAPSLAVILELTAEPKGAQLWINGDLTPYFSGQTLSVPNFSHYNPLGFVFRKAGHANCFGVKSFSGQNNIELSCQLPKL